LTDLRFLPGLESLADTIQAELTAAMERAAAEGRLQEAERKFQTLLAEFDSAGASPLKYLQVARRLQGFQDEVASLKVTDGLTERRKQLRDSASERAAAAQKAALESTRI
jgi:hypothetical protein